MPFRNNGYTSSQIQKVFYKAKHSFPKPHLDSQSPNSRAFLPFIQGTINKIAKILIKKNIKTVFKPIKTLKQSFTSVKDKINPLQQSGVYKIICSCGTSYIEQTDRSFEARIKEHIVDTNHNHIAKSTIAEHSSKSKHLIHFDQTQFLARDPY